MIIAIGGTKGGIGKTTIAVQIAVDRARAGQRVWLIDGDRQGSAIAAITNRSEAGVTPNVAAAQYPDGKTLRAQVVAQRDLYDLIVIDVGGRDSTSLRAAMILADILVVPYRPRSYDVWALSDTANLIAEARAQRDGLQAFALLNAADPGPLAADNREAAEAVADIAELEYLDRPLGSRKAIANASAMGLHVEESKPRDPKACREVAAFIRALFQQGY